jgi:hypothetical protein
MTAVSRRHDVSPRVRLAAVSLPIVLVTTLLRALGLIDTLAVIGHGALVLYVLAEWPRLPRANQWLVLAATATAGLLPILVSQPLPVLKQAFDRAAYYATFMTALAFLREAASTSPLVRRCGYLIINQPPAQRYATLSTGSLLFGIILNIGAINLLGIMTNRSNTLRAAGGNSEIQQARRRRMTLAMLRGFATTPLASPFSITLIVVLSSIPGLRWYDVLPLGLGVGVLLLAFGWWLDRRTAPRHLAPLVPPLDQRRGLKPLAQFAALVFSIVGAAFALELILEITLILAILLSAPPIGLGWMAAQRRRHGPLRAVRYASARLRRRSVFLFPSLRAEVSVLGGAGFLGVLLAAMLPPQVISDALAALHLTGPVVTVAMLIVVLTGSHIGLNPIVTVTLLASAVPDPQALGVAPRLLGVAFMAAWALAVGSSPMTASVLVLSRLADVSATTLGYRWNGPYTLAALIIVSVMLMALGYLL